MGDNLLKPQHRNEEVTIVGGSMAGRSLAALLCTIGWKVHIIEQSPGAYDPQNASTPRAGTVLHFDNFGDDEESHRLLNLCAIQAQEILPSDCFTSHEGALLLPNVPSNHAIPGHQKGRDIHVTTNEVADLCRARQKMGYEPAYGGDFDRLLQELPIGRAKAMYGDDVTVGEGRMYSHAFHGPRKYFDFPKVCERIDQVLGAAEDEGRVRYTYGIKIAEVSPSSSGGTFDLKVENNETFERSKRVLLAGYGGNATIKVPEEIFKRVHMMWKGLPVIDLSSVADAQGIIPAVLVRGHYGGLLCLCKKRHLYAVVSAKHFNLDGLPDIQNMDQDTFLALVRDRISEWNEGDAATISARRSDGSGLVYDSDEHWGACVLDEMSQKIPVIGEGRCTNLMFAQHPYTPGRRDADEAKTSVLDTGLTSFMTTSDGAVLGRMDHTKATQFVTAGLLLTHGLMRHCEEPDYDRIIDLDGHDLPRSQAGIFEHWFGD